jgi:hypothetical protein
VALRRAKRDAFGAQQLTLTGIGGAIVVNVLRAALDAAGSETFVGYLGTDETSGIRFPHYLETILSGETP